MKLLSLCLCVVLAIHPSVEVEISSNGLQRVSRGGHCTFRWTIDEPITSYTIYNQTTELRTALDPNSYHEYDNISGVITLVLIHVQLWDAGNYSLQIRKGSTTTGDSSACLFVYGDPQLTVNLTSGSQPTTEGDGVELTCSLTSTSLPTTYRPTVYYYSWYIAKYGRFQNISSGPAMVRWYGVVPGYAIRNNGRTLVISSVRYPDDEYVSCYGQEEGGASEARYAYKMLMRYRPYVRGLHPASGRVNAAIGKKVDIEIRISAEPSLTSITNWTFVNSAGISQALPSNAYSSYSSYYYPSISFILTSSIYYGSYSITVANAVGSKTVTFQVLPEGQPDTPSNVGIEYVSDITIAIRYNLMWPNSISLEQTIFIRLRLSESGATVDLSANSYNDRYRYIYGNEYYNSTHTHNFTKNIQPETNYKVSVWSVNKFGSSEVVELEVRTLRLPKLIVSSETISIKGTQAIIDFTVQASTAKSCLTPTNDGNATDDMSTPSISVIILGVLLGITSLALIGILIIYLVTSFRRNRQPHSPPQIPRLSYSNPEVRETTEERPQPLEDDTYEAVEMNPSSDHNYERVIMKPVVGYQSSKI